ncbi:MAG: PAS domain-containing sensor histidine kinase [Bdellovibrio sp. CG10_big_fil_rev_8_21_14_0_10_47_8]|nr:MAG: PAS domain-containing sensor histidine kinase [Bdellovibrio sp. CG10_big_fil_rev_8_21_14_0_10_47_8]
MSLPKVLCFGSQRLKNEWKPSSHLMKAAEFQLSEAQQEEEMAVALGFAEGPDVAGAIEALERLEQKHPLTVRLLVVQELDKEIFQQAVNQAHIYRCLSWLDFQKNSTEVLNEALQKYQQLEARASLMKESTRQFRELEALNSSLEKIVLERTQHIEISKVEEDEKLNKVRSLIRLIKDLAQTSSFEDLLQLIRKEFRKFHKVGDPILVYQSNPYRVDLISFQSGQILFTSVQGVFPFSADIDIHGKDLAKTLANHFGRPFVKTMLIPLEPRLMRGAVFAGAQACVCFEMNLPDAEIEGLLDFVRERVQPLATTVDRLLLENELVQFSYRWERTFDGFRDPIAIIDVDNEVLRANKKFAEKVYRKKCYESFAGRQTPCEGCPIFEAMNSGEPRSGQVKVENRVYEVHSYPILLDRTGTVTNVVNQYVDITQARDLYLRLLQSEKLEAMGLLAGNIAHELNNPLTGLRSLTQVLLTQVPEGSTVSADLMEIEKATERSQKIIKNLLEFSQGGTQARKITSLDQIVMKTIPMLKTVMRFHRQDILLQAPDALIEVEPHLIQQVVFNLVNNACQAMKEPGVLKIETHHDAQRHRVTLVVEDTGSGIPAEIQEKIFEPFFTTKKEGIGTGLGLSLAKKIVENDGGDIRLKSEIGRGSRFEVAFPLAERS